MVAIRNGLLSPELVPFGLHPALCSHLTGAWYKACLGADRRWVNWPGVLGVNRAGASLMVGAEVNLLLPVYLGGTRQLHRAWRHSQTAVAGRCWLCGPWQRRGWTPLPLAMPRKQTADKASRPSHQLWRLIKEDWYTLLSLAAILIAGRKREPEERCFIKRAGESIISP